MSCTATIDGARYQNTMRTASGFDSVECRVDERVGVDVVLAPHVREVDLGKLPQQRPGLLVQRLEVRALHLVATFELADHQLRVRADAHEARLEGPGRSESLDERPVFRDVVGRDSYPLAHGGDDDWRIDRDVEDHRADRGRTRVASRTPVALDLERVDRHGVGTRIA